MPRHLDLTLTSPHGTMLLSPRTGPGMSLRRAASFNSLDKGPTSSTSSRFSFNQFVNSPPPSPSLPALIPRHGKPVPSNILRRCLRMFAWLAGTMLLLYYGFVNIQRDHSLQHVGWSNEDSDQYEMIGDDALPSFATPVVVADKRGRAKWTISIPPTADFPLEPEAYSQICRQTKEASEHVAELHSHKKKTYSAHMDYYHVDQYFMDVAEAVEVGMLPKPGMASKHGGFAAPGKQGHMVGVQDDKDLIEDDICGTSLTFVMETGDAGLGQTLMLLWSAYGLAQEEGRAFFIDDSRWAYGDYMTYFALPPVPACRPPLRHEIIPCPHHARHLLVSAATVSWTFGGMFNEHYEDPKKMEVFRQEPIFDLARVGFEALFKLSDADNAYVTARIDEFNNKTSIPEGNSGIKIGVHVRHGDRHPLEFQYRSAYIPTNRYSDTARELLYTHFNDSGPDGDEDLMAEMHSLLIVASDDPDVYEAMEFSHSPRAQDLIHLASQKTVIASVAGSEPTKPSEAPSSLEELSANMFKRFQEESVGWEGGFYSAMFWSLGRAESGLMTEEDIRKAREEPTTQTLKLRELVGRAYMMDLAVLGQSDKVVCAVSAMGCKLLAVMLGWESAIVQGNWVNVDGEFEWSGVNW